MPAITAVVPVSSSLAGAVPVRLGGLDLILHPEGAALVPAEETLIVADLHLEKAASFAARGRLLPPHDSVATLGALSALAGALAPRRIVLLGDSFHSRLHTFGAASPGPALIAGLAARAELVWIAGNHDPVPPLPLPGRALPELRIGDVVLRHLPCRDGRPEIVGHLHPAARLRTRAGALRRRCFLLSPARLVLPAFGALTGALDADDPAIADWFPDRAGHAFLLGRAGLSRVPLAAVMG
ncbi:ligase-associated DNA damage response endonuclease PdeM [Rhabdaerophilum calidifontis]|uniref:ligase-associated DNA damage response endonuclease PdeM n=1 Tax=Rhabdaerophilum calidifontis TaxID=2604328 RepID=UPI001238EC69|nr:ligase-associated DNA damage response endonuclease PdeM [Rhabdaerophilum calidifontis]